MNSHRSAYLCCYSRIKIIKIYLVDSSKNKFVLKYMYRTDEAKYYMDLVANAVSLSTLFGWLILLPQDLFILTMISDDRPDLLYKFIRILILFYKSKNFTKF